MKYTMRVQLQTILMGALCSAPAFSSDRNFEAYSISRNDGTTIQYYLQKPHLPASRILLIVLQGSDCNSVTHDKFIYDVLRNAWPAADLLVVEKYGITADLTKSASAERPDCPDLYIEKDSPTQRLDDLKRVTRKVLENADYQSVIVLGGSEGATIAAMFAAKTHLPDAVVLINGGGRWFLDDVLHSIGKQSPGETLQQDLDGFKGFAAHVTSSERFDLQVSNHGYSWWREMLTIDQQELLQKITTPVLVVQSGKDESVLPAAVSTLQEQLRKSGKNNIDWVVYPDLDHGLSDSKGNSEAAQVVAGIHRWLQTQLKIHSGK